MPLQVAILRKKARCSTSNRAKSRYISEKDRALLRESLCLITSEYGNIDCCHVIAFIFLPSQMTCLEYAWGLPACGLYVNGPRNLIPLRPDMHRRFDRDEFIFLPDSAILESLVYIYVNVPTAKCPRYTIAPYLVDPADKDAQAYCRLVPLKNLSDFPITRQRGPTDEQFFGAPPGFNQAHGGVDTYWWPYELLPRIASSLAVEYAIVNIAVKFEAMSSKERSATLDLIKTYPNGRTVHDDLQNVFQIYKRWMTEPPEDFVQLCDQRADPAFEAESENGGTTSVLPDYPTALVPHSPGLPGMRSYAAPRGTPGYGLTPTRPHLGPSFLGPAGAYSQLPHTPGAAPHTPGNPLVAAFGQGPWRTPGT